MFIIHAMMTYVLVSRDKKFARWEVLSYSLPKMIEILLRHSSYIIGIFLKNQKRACSIIVTVFGFVSAVIGVNICFIPMLRNCAKYYEINFETVTWWYIILIPSALLISLFDVYLLNTFLNKKCDACGKAISYWTSEVNNKLTNGVCVFLFFISVFALLKENPNDYIKAISTVVVVFVFLLEKLLFGNNNQKRV